MFSILLSIVISIPNMDRMDNVFEFNSTLYHVPDKFTCTTIILFHFRLPEVMMRAIGCLLNLLFSCNKETTHCNQNQIYRHQLIHSNTSTSSIDTYTVTPTAKGQKEILLISIFQICVCIRLKFGSEYIVRVQPYFTSEYPWSMKLHFKWCSPLLLLYKHKRKQSMTLQHPHSPHNTNFFMATDQIHSHFKIAPGKLNVYLVVLAKKVEHILWSLFSFLWTSLFRAGNGRWSKTYSTWLLSYN